MTRYRGQRFTVQSSRPSSVCSACRTSARRSRECIPRSAGSSSSNSIAANPISNASRATADRETDSRRCSSRRRFVASSSSRSRRVVTIPNRTLSSGSGSELSSSCMHVYDARGHFNAGGRQ
jgi:hypothetical protein